MDKEDDERIEAAIASLQSLQPNFKAKGISQDRVSKFQELHRQRLQIKSKSKFHNKSKGISCGTSKSYGKDPNSKHQDDEDTTTKTEDLSVPDLKIQNYDTSSSVHQDLGTANLAPKKRQKLHWGLDTKERWERKANM